MERVAWWNPFKSLFAGTSREQYVERHILRELEEGRALAEILEDPYVRAWSTPEERARLLNRPAILAAVGDREMTNLQAAAASPGQMGSRAHRREPGSSAPS